MLTRKQIQSMPRTKWGRCQKCGTANRKVGESKRVIDGVTFSGTVQCPKCNQQ